MAPSVRQPPLLTLEGIAFRTRQCEILQDINLTIPAGEIHALLGANGTGKSTLARIVMGCAGYRQAAGTVRFDGQPINELPIHERARLGITMAWQEPARFDGLSVRQFLQLGDAGGDPAAHLLRVGLEPDRYLARPLDKTLSGGERKRVELASLLAMKPRLAILDEPTSGIDLMSLGEMAAVIRSLRTERSSVLLITHQEEIARIADRASYLCAGKLLLTDAPSVVAARFRRRPCGETCNGEACK